MNASGYLDPRADREWVRLSYAMPVSSGVYSIRVSFLGVQKAEYCNGTFYWMNGEQIPDSIILGWK